MKEEKHIDDDACAKFAHNTRLWTFFFFRIFVSNVWQLFTMEFFQMEKKKTSLSFFKVQLVGLLPVCVFSFFFLNLQWLIVIIKFTKQDDRWLIYHGNMSNWKWKELGYVNDGRENREVFHAPFNITFHNILHLPQETISSSRQPS